METTLTQPSQSVILPGISWATYELMRKDYASHYDIRLNYNQGKLEIITAISERALWSENIATVVAVIADCQGRADKTTIGGPVTFIRKDLGFGLEPDACFYFERADQIRTKTGFDFQFRPRFERILRDFGKQEIDLSTAPVPELVLDIDDISLSVNRLSLYARANIREVWRFKEMRITIYGLERDSYTEREYSLICPTLSRERLNFFVYQSQFRLGEWMRNLCGTVREN